MIAELNKEDPSNAFRKASSASEGSESSSTDSSSEANTLESDQYPVEARFPYVQTRKNSCSPFVSRRGNSQYL